MIEFNYNFIGNIDVSNIIVDFNNLDWDYWTYRQETYDVHSQTKAIPILIDYVETYSTKGIKSKFYGLLTPILSELETKLKKFYGDGQIIRIELVNLPNKSKVKPHYDKGESLEEDNRVHLPLQTSKSVIFKVGGEEKNMKVGELWEINNKKLHSVENNDNMDRIHMIIDFKKVNTYLI